MNAPRRPDGPPVRDGKPYSAIAHLAEDIVPYIAVAAGLRDLGLSAPEILHADLDHGLIVMEDFGNERIVDGDPPAPIEERYAAAVDLLAALHGRELPDMLPVTSELDLSAARLRHGGVPDRGRAAARLVPDWRRRARHDCCTRGFRQALARGAVAGDRGAADLGVARLPFAQPAMAGAA